jgi:hypothetical protein
MGQLSGAHSTRFVGGDGISTPISVKDATPVLRPIIERALGSGLSIVAKVDCKSSEFQIFQSLESSGLLGHIPAFIVEWHRGAAEKTQRDLLKPLLRSGYLAFDVTPNDRSAGNGFFTLCDPAAGQARPSRTTVASLNEDDSLIAARDSVTRYLHQRGITQVSNISKRPGDFGERVSRRLAASR